MKLGVKLLAAPLLTAMVVLITGQISAALINLESEKGLVSSKTSLEHFKITAQVQQQLGQVHARVYKTVALIGSMDDLQIKAYRAELGKQVHAIQQVADKLATDNDNDAAIRAATAEVAKQLEKYAKQADSAVDLASVDPNTGVAAMQGADTTSTGYSLWRAYWPPVRRWDWPGSCNARLCSNLHALQNWPTPSLVATWRQFTPANKMMKWAT